MRLLPANRSNYSLIIACLLLHQAAFSEGSSVVHIGAVASDQQIASQAGAAILAEGGNSFDAAVTTALVLGVINPVSSGIGGGGLATFYDVKRQKVQFLDFREEAPSLLTPKRFVKDGKIQRELSRRGGLAVGVPGEICGLYFLWKHHGSLPWARVIRPAVALAQNGFTPSPFTKRAALLVMASSKSSPELRKLLVSLANDRLVKRPELAATLKRVAKNGPRGFYSGETADDIVAAVKAAGGVMEQTDLSRYRPIPKAPLLASWRGFRIAAPNLPSSGGVALITALGILERIDDKMRNTDEATRLHLVAEALKHAFADRGRLLGAEVSPALLTKLTSSARLQNLANKVRAKSVIDHKSYGSRNWSPAKGELDDNGTSHFCIVDGRGNAVSLTTTVNGYFGSRVMAAGMVLNNEMDDFSLSAGKKNMYGLVHGEENVVQPGRRPLSSMTPTLIFRHGAVVGCVGGSGGPKIISNSIQVTLNAFKNKMPAARAVAAKRIHHQWTPNKLILEQGTAAGLAATLRAKGHDVDFTSHPTAVQLLRKVEGKWTGAADPRKGGSVVIVAPKSE